MELLSKSVDVRLDPDLHLATSMRSFRAENLSGFVKAALDGDVDRAKGFVDELRRAYPLCFTRELDVAKQWIRARARGTERYGLLASSQAERLKPHAIDIRVDVDP